MMQPWFPDAKLGIFIHWGIYAVKGIDESWSFFNKKVTYGEYMDQLGGFTASNYDPEAWADLFAKTGARYVVLTSKHHDGVALWDTKANDLSVVQKTPAGRDLMTPYLEALRQKGLKTGVYYSHLDWSHPDYAAFQNPNPGEPFNKFTFREGPTDLEAWERFLAFHRAQLKELCTEFGDIDLLWFDGDWDHGAETWRMKELRDQLHAWQPNVVINSRMQGYGDYETPEQGLPIVPPSGPWEFCMTMNDNWGYQGSDSNYKSSGQIIQIFVECISKGGNLLLDIGPMEDGTIPPEQVERLEDLGRWIRKHSQAVFETKAGLLPGHFHGPSTLSNDDKTLYLFVNGRPSSSLCLRGLKTDPKRVSVVGSGEELGWKRLGGAVWMAVPGVIWVDPPVGSIDTEITVIKLEFDEPLQLYRGSSGAIEQN